MLNYKQGKKVAMKRRVKTKIKQIVRWEELKNYFIK